MLQGFFQYRGSNTKWLESLFFHKGTLIIKILCSSIISMILSWITRVLTTLWTLQLHLWSVCSLSSISHLPFHFCWHCRDNRRKVPPATLTFLWFGHSDHYSNASLDKILEITRVEMQSDKNQNYKGRKTKWHPLKWQGPK